MYIEDAGIPGFAMWLVQLAQAGAITTAALGEWAKRKVNLKDDTNLSAELNKILLEGAFSSKFMPLLGMGRDRPDGVFSIDGEPSKLRLKWTVDTSDNYYRAMTERMRIIAWGFGGKLRENPLYTWPTVKRGITVHPVGGCPMDTTLAQGLVDTYGRVRGVDGLRVCDGSVFPGPIGPNPSLTIAAFARRSAENLDDEKDFAKLPNPADPWAGRQ
jgi:cholesterol oxidase